MLGVLYIITGLLRIFIYKETRITVAKESRTHTNFVFFSPFFSLIVLSLTLSLRQVGRQRSDNKKKGTGTKMLRKDNNNNNNFSSSSSFFSLEPKREEIS